MHAEERAGKILLIVPSRQSAIARTHAAQNGMRGHVESPCIEIKTDVSRCVLSKLSLSVQRKASRQQARVWTTRASLNGIDQLDEFIAQRSKRR